VFTLDASGDLVTGGMLATQPAGFTQFSADAFIVFQTPAQISTSGNIPITCSIAGSTLYSGAFTCISQGSTVFQNIQTNAQLDQTSQGPGPDGSPLFIFTAVPHSEP
jgi:hypothetical protein